MDALPAAGTGPWLVVAVVLGVLGLVVAVAVTIAVRRPSGPAGPTAAPERDATSFRDDDLPGFLERPPGSTPAVAIPPAGWTALSSPPAPVAPTLPHRAPGRWTPRRIAAAVLAALLLLGAAISAAVAAADSRPAGSAHSAASSASSSGTGSDVVSADLTFGGVVLERHVVGITATYPRVRLTSGTAGLVAHVELPTYNCLATEAPADPVAAGCAGTVPEYADLPAPALRVSRTPDGQLRLDGRFPTYTRPNGGAAVRTGRVYELLITAAAADGRPSTGQVPAAGELRLGAGRTTTTGVSVVRFAD